jgi:phospholipid N-methyltransferase
VGNFPNGLGLAAEEGGPRVPDPATADGLRTLAEWDAREAWFTPGSVVEQGLWAARLLAQVNARRVIDLGAGAGVMGQRVGRVYRGAQRLGIEIRPAEAPYLRRHYERHIIGDMFAERGQLARWGADLVVSNPPYSKALAALQLALSVVRLGGHVLFFVRGTFGSRADVWAFLTRHPPIHEFGVAGRPNMREGISAAGHVLGGDMVGHMWLLFRRARPSSRPRWPRELLPPLDTWDLRWRVRPGTESDTPVFPDLYLPIAA